MSLKRILNPPSDDEDQSHDGNLWPDDDARVRPRLDWSMDTSEDIEALAYQLDDSEMMILNQFDTSFPASVADEGTLLQPISENAFLSETSFMSTPGAATDEGSGDADVEMADDGTSEPGEQICYGMFMQERVKLLGKAQDLQEKIAKLCQTNTERKHTFPIKQSNRNNGELFLTFPDGSKLGQLTEKMVRALRSLASQPQFEMEAPTDLRIVANLIHHASKASEAKIRVNINVYGLESHRDQIGKELSNHGLFLQPPKGFRVELRYDNPHLLRLDGMDKTDSEEEKDIEVEEVDIHTPPERNQDFGETMADVFESLRRPEGLNRLEGNENLNRALYSHQAEALDFMMQRETGHIPDEYRLWKPETIGGVEVFRHVITKTREHEQPDESGGGILADEMGMGKSLTTLVLIGNTMGDARQWVEGQKRLPDPTLAEIPCRATLVIVPSRVLINTWEKEIQDHLNDSLKLLTYHGRSRKEVLNDLDSYDIVITTYNTLAKEHDAKSLGRGKSPLHNFAWYRVVLDEAHMIRRRETTFHKAVVELSAKSRWCLSGTPIQNSLADLASLLAFIKVRPLHDIRIFRHWISLPFDVNGLKQRAVRHLTKLLDAICLRRTFANAHLDLPEPQQEIRKIQLTPDERAQYDLTQSGMQRYIMQQVGEYNQRASTYGMFQVFQQLRSFCNHGTYQPPWSWAKRNLLDEEADSVRSLGRNSLDRCSGCRQPLPIVHRDRRPRYVEGCNHVLCDDCSKGSNQHPNPNGRLNCPWCKFLRGPNAEDHRQENRLRLASEGYSSKMQALIADVETNLDTKKSIIFSCWTRTLDLIGRHLRTANIEFERIDGKTRSSHRQDILDRFDGTSHKSVLIMTTGTGAFGLNLQSVTRVFIVEPQWNPSVESQAVARAVRLGQTHQVQVIRYQVEDSIEQDMCSQQKQKLKISKMEFDHVLPAAQQDSNAVIVETRELVQDASI
ncbi:SNF2 family N-terminal domain-containing protein [Aspergillus cavernicola]|uniref:SNF2 family N-terminal domain-containing protein n=1 Tax=Aspergillus cavernicola TaxID=176166 RepID=A0ABR4HZE0_9EURO